MSIKGKTKLLFKKAKNSIASSFASLEKKVVFESFHGKQYSDNPRAISEKMHELFPDYKIVWAMNDLSLAKELLPDYVHAVETGSMEYLRERASAAAYVRNEAMTVDITKQKGQLFIQTWHGDRGIKKILYDAWEKGERPTKVMDNELTDLFVVGSDYAENRIKSAFEYHGKTLKTGCPRNDCLVFPHDETEIKAKLGIDPSAKILLYAPTLRKGGNVVQSTLNIEETLRHFEKDGSKWVCIIRAHPKSMGLKVQNPEQVIDVSKYPDMSDLLMISDALITDYSSCAGDFILRKKPIILAQFDREQYVKEERSFFIDIDETGFLTAHDQNELNHIIDTTSEDDYRANCEQITAFFGTCETGRSSEEVCRYINDHFISLS